MNPLRIVIKGINPEPWAIGTVNCWGKGTRGKISPNDKLKNYQQAIREELENKVFDLDEMWAKAIHIYFYRNTERGNQADTTNLLKAAEDALKGILFNDDRTNRKVTGEIMEQGTQVQHVGLVIEFRDYEFDPDFHATMAHEMFQAPAVAFRDTEYQAPEEDYI